MATPIDTLTANLLRPMLTRTSTAETRQFPLKDQIEAAKFLLAQSAGKGNRLGLRFRKYLPGHVLGQVDATSGSVDDGSGQTL